MLVIQLENTLAHCQVVVPVTQFHLRLRYRVETLNDCRVERIDERRVYEIQQVGNRRPQAFDAVRVQCPACHEYFFRLVAAVARVEQSAEGTLVRRVLVDVGDAQFGLPEERVVCSLENLALLRDGRDYRFERRAAIRVAKHTGFDFLDDLPDALADGPENS
jgi:hypothetical protein